MSRHVRTRVVNERHPRREVLRTEALAAPAGWDVLELACGHQVVRPHVRAGRFRMPADAPARIAHCEKCPKEPAGRRALDRTDPDLTVRE